MASSTKENVLIFIALVITYLGIYLLTQANTLGVNSSDARWAGFFSVTLGVFVFLTLLFGHADNGAVPAGTPGGQWGNAYSIVAVAALVASAFFNFKVARQLPNGNLRYVVYGNIVAHVLLILAYFVNLDGATKRFQNLRFGNSPNNTTYVPSTPAMGLTSPRLPVRAR